MNLVFDEGLYSQFLDLEPIYRLIMEEAFALTKTKGNYEVDVSLVNEETIQTINRDYRGIDRITDVISFAFNDDESSLGHIQESAYEQLLGEIFICVPRAKAQAEEIGNSLQREMRFLFAHGMLHLLGYDHQNEEEEAIMFDLQEKILSNVMEKTHGH